ncbi:MAG: SGNH/GDSL hydrolase family protein, partial [Puniceicoccales bacterium]
MLQSVKTFTKVLLLALATTGAAEASPYAYQPRPLEECNPRDGWPHFYQKVEEGEPVTIAYLGGSITEQRGWRVHTMNWFKHKYPEVKFTEVNAAIGGTGSNLGVFRLDRDVLEHEPDFLLVEFAVNDAGFYPANIRKAMEGIIRKTRQQYPDCDIGFVYTLTARDAKAMDKGEMQRSASVMEEVADHYGIPSIHFGESVWELYQAGKLELVAKGNQAP